MNRKNERDIDLDQEVKLDRKGGRITEARAAEMAEEMYQNAQHGGRRPGSGRPSLSGGTSPQLTLRLPAELRAELEKLAAKANLTVSKYVRSVLEEKVRKAG